ncbi:hypothetical protein CRG98_018142 [Punica granatum]|uniref:Uncharacterized protein n=1 Tax=Punica granatum TaxID=22663 RepID=A0A2I0JYP8_PUNGR|nr:hypothetical protein CRG98_018142 [Punica granatum]
MAQATKSDHTDVEPRPIEPIVLQGTVDSDPGTQERSCPIQRQIVGYCHRIVLIRHHDVRVATVGGAPVSVLGIVSEDHAGTVTRNKIYSKRCENKY